MEFFGSYWKEQSRENVLSTGPGISGLRIYEHDSAVPLWNCSKELCRESADGVGGKQKKKLSNLHNICEYGPSHSIRSVSPFIIH